LLPIDEKVKTAFVIVLLLVRANPRCARPAKVAKGAGRTAKQDRLVVTRQPAKPLTVHNFPLAMRAGLAHFAIVSQAVRAAAARRRCLI
jgi:hypothetical protein